MVLTGSREFDDVLLDARLVPPARQQGSIPRQELIEAGRSSACRVVAVTAPAGYGKSTLLAEWAASEDRPVAWVSLDPVDDDPAAVLTLLAAAFARAVPGNDDMVTRVGGPGVSLLGRAAPRLAAMFRACQSPFVIMVDDLDVLRDPLCHDVLGIAIDGVPAHSQVVVASRSEQPHVPRLRAADDVLEVGADELAFDADATQQLFERERFALQRDIAVALTERTEGWPVGLQLAALIARETGEISTQLTGSDRYVAEYLYHEIFSQQTQELQQFLRRSAILDQLSEPLCEHVLGMASGRELLHMVRMRNLFIVELDRRREWCRYHALFREFLLRELHRTEPDIVEELRLRAADWYESNGPRSTAVEHLLGTTAVNRASRLVVELAVPTYMAGRLTTLQRWIASAEQLDTQPNPPLAAMASWIAALTGDSVAAFRSAAAVEAAPANTASADGASSFESTKAMVRALLCANGPKAMLADAEYAVAHEPGWSPWRDSAQWLLGEAKLMTSDIDGAALVFEQSSAQARKFGNTDSIAICDAELAMMAMDRGDDATAHDLVRRAFETVEANHLDDYLMSIPVFVAAARLAQHRGDLIDCERQLTRAMRARPTATVAVPYLAVRIRRRLAQLHLALGDPKSARHLVQEINGLLIERPLLGSLLDDVDELKATLASSSAGPTTLSPLSPAELRLLPYLQTHLTMSAVAERLFVSRNTVKTQVRSIYRKLVVSSRSEAVERATEIGLLGG